MAISRTAPAAAIIGITAVQEPLEGFRFDSTLGGSDRGGCSFTSTAV